MAEYTYSTIIPVIQMLASPHRRASWTQGRWILRDVQARPTGGSMRFHIRNVLLTIRSESSAKGILLQCTKSEIKLCGPDLLLTAYFFRVLKLWIEPSGTNLLLTAYFFINKKSSNCDFVCRQTAKRHGRCKCGFQNFKNVCRQAARRHGRCKAVSAVAGNALFTHTYPC